MKLRLTALHCGWPTCLTNHMFSLSLKVFLVLLRTAVLDVLIKLYIGASGCWSYHGDFPCDDNSCVAHEPPRGNLPNTTRFCCCRGDHCNRIVVDNVSAAGVPLPRDSLSIPAQDALSSTVLSTKWPSLVNIEALTCSMQIVQDCIF